MSKLLERLDELEAQHTDESWSPRVKELQSYVRALRTTVEALDGWLKWEREQIAKEGPYAGERITKLIAAGENALAAAEKEICGAENKSTEITGESASKVK